MLSVFITPWMKPTFIHCAMRAAWRAATASSRARKGCGASAISGSCRAIAYSRELPHLFRLAARSEELEGPDADVARRHAREHRAGQRASRAGPARPWPRPPAPASWGCPARAWPRRSAPREASARRPPCRRHCARTACGPSLSTRCRGAASAGRSPRRAAARARRQAAARIPRTGGPHRPARWAPRPRAARCRRTRPAASVSSSDATSSPSSSASAWFRNRSRGAGTATGFQGT